MKRKHLLLLTLLLSQSAPLWGMMNEEETGAASTHHQAPRATLPASNIEKLHNSIQEAIKSIHANPDYERDVQRVIVVGKIGRGKTTLLHYLAERDLRSRQVPESNRYFLDVAEQDRIPGFHIGTSVDAGTGLPSSWYDARTNTVYWDSPGFGDPAGAEQEIINTFAIHQLFKSSKPTKIVLVASEKDADTIEGRADDFLQVLKRVSDVLPDSTHLNPPSQGLSLVITKQRDSEPHNLLRRILGQLSASQNHEFRSGPVRDLIELLSDRDRSAALPAPTGLGNYPIEPRDKILKSINSTQSMVNPKVNLVVSDGAKVLVRNYAQSLNGRISHLIESEGAQFITDYCNTQINNHVGTVGTLRATLKDMGGYLDGIKRGLLNLTSIPEDQLAAHLDSVFTPNVTSILPVTPLRRMIETFSFLKSIESNITFDAAAWAHGYSTLIEKIQQLTKDPEIEVNQNQLTLKGIIIGTSDIVQALQNRQRTNISRVDAFGVNTLFIDEDINNPGTSLSLIAPNMKVINDRIINLSGLSGNRGANGLNPGEDGKPGKPGGNSGNFYSKILNGHRTEHLKIILSGGPGGIGGDGAKGKDGDPGKNGELTDETISGNYTYYQAQGKDGTPGQNGGRGGHGGLGGHKGLPVIDGDNRANIISSDGGKGDPGNPGEGGKGGDHGKHCQGTYETGRTYQRPYTDYRTAERMVPYTAYRTERRVREETYEISAWDEMPTAGKIFSSIVSFGVAPAITSNITKYATRNVFYDAQVPYEALRKEKYQEPYTAWETAPLPDVWQVQQGYLDRNPSSAKDGKKPDKQDINDIGQLRPPAQISLDRNTILTNYNGYNQHTAADPVTAGFVKSFPNL